MKYQLEYFCGQTIRNVVVKIGHWQGDGPFIRCDGYGLSEEVEMEHFEPTFPHIPCPKCGLSISVGHMMWSRVDGVSTICKSRTISTSSSLREAQKNFLYAWAMLGTEVAQALGLDRLVDWLERKIRKLLGRGKYD